MKTLSIDIETYSSIDLTKSGVYKYTQNDFEILLIAYAYDDEEIKIIDLKNNEKIPPQLKKDILDENIIKTAFNANFERVCLKCISCPVLVNTSTTVDTPAYMLIKIL